MKAIDEDAAGVFMTVPDPSGMVVRLSTLIAPQVLNPPTVDEFDRLTLKDLVQRIGLVRYLDSASGFFDVLPLGKMILDRVEPSLLKAARSIGLQDMKFAPVQPRKLLEVSGRSEQFGGDIYELPGHGDAIVLSPAHEEYFTALCKSIGVRSARQLPVGMFAFDQVIRRQRNRAAGGLAWTGQIPAFATYSIALDAQDLRLEGLTLLAAFERLLVRSGATTMRVHRGEDFVDLMVESEMGREVVEECPECGRFTVRGGPGHCDHVNAVPLEHRAMSGAMHFIAGDHFSKAMRFRVQTAGSMVFPVLATSGFGLSRLLAVLTERGRFSGEMRWPSGLSPIDAYIFPSSPDFRDESNRLGKELGQLGYNSLVDDTARPNIRSAQLVGADCRIQCDSSGFQVQTRGANGSTESAQVDTVAQLGGLLADVVEGPT